MIDTYTTLDGFNRKLMNVSNFITKTIKATWGCKATARKFNTMKPILEGGGAVTQQQKVLDVFIWNNREL